MAVLYRREGQESVQGWLFEKSTQERHLCQRPQERQLTLARSERTLPSSSQTGISSDEMGISLKGDHDDTRREQRGDQPAR